jgi:hypothetical protein
VAAGVSLQKTGRPFEDAAELVLAPTRSWGFVALTTTLFGIFQVGLLRSGRAIHDEGLLTWLYASYLSRDPVATLFFLKAKPALAILNLPGSLFGLRGFFFGHIAIGCAGVVATAAAARAARVREWGLVALVVACSPMYLMGSAGGLSNVDVAALTAVALWLIFRRPVPGFGTAVVLSVLPLVRFEAGVFVAVAAVAIGARDKNPRFVLGLLVLPVTYFLVGAVWHGDALWPVHFVPAPFDIARTGVHQGALEEVHRASPADAIFAITTTTPVLGLAFVRIGGRAEWVRVAQLSIVAFLVALVALPVAGVAMGYSQRYFLQILPVAALVVGRQLEDRPSRWGVATLVVVAFGVFVDWLRASGDHPQGAFNLAALVGTLLVAMVAARLSTRLAWIGLAALVLAWPFAGPPLDVFQPARRATVMRVVEWLRAHPDDIPPSRAVVTNLKLLDATLNQTSHLPPFDVYCLLQSDNEYELTQFTNPANGQRARLIALARWRFYGHGLFAEDFARAPGPGGALVVLQPDDRLKGIDVEGLLAAGATPLMRSPDVSIMRLDADADGRGLPARSSPAREPIPELVYSVPVGEEDLVAAMLGRGELLAGGCRLTRVDVAPTHIDGIYRCENVSEDVIMTLAHVGSPDPSPAFVTREFAVRTQNAPADLVEALRERIVERETAWHWLAVAGETGEGPHEATPRGGDPWMPVLAGAAAMVLFFLGGTVVHARRSRKSTHKS